jgi:ATP-dependent Clp protease ATP-binding subunit ClpA
MQRLIQDTIRRALADELLFGKLLSGGRVTVDVDENDKVLLTFDENPVPRNPNPEAVEVE